MPIWFLTIKSQKLPWFAYVQVMCKWCATYPWKDFDEGYNFALGITSIRGLNKKLRAPKMLRVPISRILKLPTREFQDKMTFGCNPYG